MTMRVLTTFIVAVLASTVPGSTVLGSAVASAQAPAAPAPAPAQGASAGTPAGQAPQTPAAQAPAPAKPNPLEPTGYTYDPEGRRDPFVSLVRRGTESEGAVVAGARPAGLAGMSTNEVVLVGTLRGRTGYVALLRGVDRRERIAQAGDKLFDGTISAVTENSVVILQQVNDPLSLATQREVRKVLRQTEEAK